VITLNPTLSQHSLGRSASFPKKDRVDLIVVMIPVLVHEDLWITMRKNGIVQFFLLVRELDLCSTWIFFLFFIPFS
jgi:hypothetical protein